MPHAKKARAIGVNHVALEVGDIDQALASYGRLFEFEVRSRSRTSAFIDLGGHGSSTSSTTIRAAARREARAAILTPLVIRAIREACGLSQQAAARVFGGGPKAFEKHETGEIDCHSQGFFVGPPPSVVRA